MGGRKPTVSDEEILSILVTSDDPVLAATEVAESLSIGQTGTYRRLRRLEDEGLVASKKIGQGRAWWISDAGREFVEESTEA